MLTKLTIATVWIVTACRSEPPHEGGLAELRLTPDQARAAAAGEDKNQIGSSRLPGVRTTVLYGEPSKPGLYSILLSVPPNTTIQAHSHRDDRMATVVSGTWYFGYGDRFDTARLQELPAGSVYSEPGTRAHNHFAQTRHEPVVVHIVGYGPTDTVYVDPANEPRPK
jgi:quercetin dioxygenase-like cupin family protein